MKLPKLIAHLVEPHSKDPDVRRQEFILNIFTVAILGLLSVATISSVSSTLYSTPETRTNNVLSLWIIFVLLAFFSSLLLLSRRGLVRLASYLLIAMLFLFSVYMAYRWGIELPAAILFDVLVIVMAGILVNTRSAFYAMGAACISVLVLGILQQSGILVANRYWTQENWNILDTLVTSAILAIIAVVSSLSNREIERSLARATHSEAVLKKERDLLEVRVEERTEALRRSQIEQMTQAYRFVEFGRLAGGLFHEIGNPLSALSLDIEHIAQSHERGMAFEAFASDLARARRAASRMQELMNSMRRHLAHESPKEFFSVPRALSEISSVLKSYALSHDMKLVVHVGSDVGIYGDLAAFTQAITSIVSNAIEAYQVSGDCGPREVHIAYSSNSTETNVSVRDFGPGIPTEMRDKIFEPFFTTKGARRGLGIGLPLARRVIEKEFGGKIVIHTPEDGRGSVFAISFPARGRES
ncbi:MAG TPA: HAMP domain-containing sensor histidine kinase [Candidatus Paceibacterota bacterium]|nr:HAMP domain-containing sensor histidine kinase [Candidatus Paceibacterota bacterium]